MKKTILNLTTIASLRIWGLQAQNSSNSTSPLDSTKTTVTDSSWTNKGKYWVSLMAALAPKIVITQDSTFWANDMQLWAQLTTPKTINSVVYNPISKDLALINVFLLKDKQVAPYLFQNLNLESKEYILAWGLSWSLSNNAIWLVERWKNMNHERWYYFLIWAVLNLNTPELRFGR